MANSLDHDYLYKKKRVVFVLRVIDCFLNFIIRKTTKRLPGEVRKILIVKPDHLGDFLLMSSVLKILVREFPCASLDVLIGPWSRPVAENYPQLNKIWLIRHAQQNRKDRGIYKWILFLTDVLSVLPKIRREKYDLVLLLRAFGGNFVFTSPFFNARYVAGHKTGGGAALLNACASWQEGAHEVEHFGEVLSAIGVFFNSSELLPFFPEVGSKFNLSILPSEFICVHPGAGAQNKKLSFAAWKAVLNASTEPLVVCGSYEEKNWIIDMQFDSNRRVINLVDRLQINDLLAVYNRARTVHVLDSFPAHLAATSQCSRVIVHFLPASDPAQWAPIGPNVEVVLHPETQ